MTTSYRSHTIKSETGKRDTWYNVFSENGDLLHRAATEYSAMQFVDRIHSQANKPQ